MYITLTTLSWDQDNEKAKVRSEDVVILSWESLTISMQLKLVKQENYTKL
jgi:hypothetical protein